MKITVGIISFIGGAVVVYLFISLGILNSIPGIQEEVDFKLPVYINFIGVMMTAITVVLTALAIGITVVAVFTFREIKQEAQKSAITKIEETLTEKYVKDFVARIVFAGIGPEQQTPSDRESSPSNDTNAS
ncbi:MAG: hypothetical protein OXE98_05185 [Hyphomicrobiales bacterium]|nr:hypothetical protein [Hyphomicrobiales bacterium]MCY4053258.1 hypothetical protein [Hyphomicrobiales bacterium]